MHQSAFPPTMYYAFLSCTASLELIFCWFVYDGHSDWFELVSHCGYSMHFSDGSQCGASFHMSLGLLYILLGEVSVQVFCAFLIGLFVFLVRSHVSSLYILEIRPLSEVSLANIFSHTVDSLFILLMFSLAVQKLFILMRSHLFILSFMSLDLGDISLKMSLHGIWDFPAYVLL